MRRLIHFGPLGAVALALGLATGCFEDPPVVTDGCECDSLDMVVENLRVEPATPLATDGDFTLHWRVRYVADNCEDGFLPREDLVRERVRLALMGSEPQALGQEIEVGTESGLDLARTFSEFFDTPLQPGGYVADVRLSQLEPAEPGGTAIPHECGDSAGENSLTLNFNVQ